MPHRVTGQNCKYSEACGREATWAHEDGAAYCALHLPLGPGKDPNEFSTVLAEYMKAGRSDFRWVRFPEVFSGTLENQTFNHVVDFAGATIKVIGLANSRLLEGLRVTESTAERVDLMGAAISGPVEVVFRGRGDVRLTDATATATVTCVAPRNLDIEAHSGIFQATASFLAPSLGTASFHQAFFPAGLKLRGRLLNMPNFNGTRIGSFFDLSECELPSLTLAGTPDLTPGTILDVRSAIIRGDCWIAATEPCRILIDRTFFGGECFIRSPLGHPPISIIADEARPMFNSEVRLTNVDLSRCLLVGNFIPRITFSDVLWPKLNRRFALYDEVALHKGQPTPLASIRGAYQALKQTYQSMGDHVHAGDFYYGEMEMRRHSRSNLSSLFCWEFPYWLFSAYGTRPSWAFGWLCLLTLISALLYLWSDPSAGFLEALRFSVSVTTLQRRDLLVDAGGWIKVIQTIFGAVLIALFVLAVRMRLRR